MPALLKTVTLGCKVNQYETQFVREGLMQLGYQQAEDGDAAELCLVNTCTITGAVCIAGGAVLGAVVTSVFGRGVSVIAYLVTRLNTIAASRRAGGTRRPEGFSAADCLVDIRADVR